MVLSAEIVATIQRPRDVAVHVSPGTLPSEIVRAFDCNPCIAANDLECCFCSFLIDEKEVCV